MFSDWEGINRVQQFITLSAPNHGTWIAYCGQGVGCIQMRPDSALLQDLNRDAVMLEQINFTSIWTPYDLMIVPANSSQMPVGKNVVVPVFTHAGIADALKKSSSSGVRTLIST